MLRGIMMDRPLLVSSVIDYAADIYPDVEIVSNTVEGGIHRYGYAASRERIGKLANALIGLGIKPGDRVATLAWNGYRHFELYYAIAGIGAVCHTINPRLFPEQLDYIVRHAGDRVLFFGGVVAGLVRQMRPSWPSDLKYVAMEDAKATAAIDGIPGLSDLPVLGRLFSHTQKSTDQTDIVLTLTPHIVRVLDLSESDLRAFKIGRDTVQSIGGDQPLVPIDVPAPAPPPGAPTQTPAPAPGPAPGTNTNPLTAPRPPGT